MSSMMASLVTPGLPWCFALQVSIQDLTGRISTWSRAGLTVRVLRGRKMPTYQGLFDEFAAALQFPWYFGENGNAFDDCITDLSWLPPGKGYVLAITDGASVLKDTEDSGLSWLISSLDRAALVWSEPCAEVQPWDRPATPFHVVLHDEDRPRESPIRMWRENGAEVALLE